MRLRIGVAAAVVAIAVLTIVLISIRGAGVTATSAATPSMVGSAPASSAEVVREDSHILGESADGSVEVVEFLDFECESCAAWHPVVEQLRERYAGQVRFVARYFPMPSHLNSMSAALAVEAAALQGRFEDMYIIMFGTQQTWGHSSEDQAPMFRAFAADLGLDLDAYDTAINDPATRARVEKDKNDGIALGVQGTPTFFLNGEKIQPVGVDDFAAMIDEALVESTS